MKFSIRDLMLVTMIVALALGWGLEHRQQAKLMREAQSKLLGEYRATRANGRREPLPLTDY
jgi:hypothetical protein